MYTVLNFSHDSNLDIEDIIAKLKGYYPDANFNMLKKAYEFAKEAHKGQKRSSGEDYIIHPINVTMTLIKLKMDMDTIISGLLHDVLEDCGVSEKTLEVEFNSNVAKIVIGLTKISKIKFRSKEESTIENFRKMIVAMSNDIRVIIVKLADRLNNMLTLEYLSVDRQKRIAQETLNIYVPLAGRMGIYSIKDELEECCLKYLHPDIYSRLKEKISNNKKYNDEYIKETIDEIVNKLLEYSVKAVVKGRVKKYYSIYKKMISSRIDFDQVQDILAFRIIVDNITECYKALGIIHSAYKPIPGRFKDYIAISKINGYQSLHTTVIGPKAERIEIQIRTTDMDEVAESGIAAHWKYKEGISTIGSKLDWTQQLLDYTQQLFHGNEFIDFVKESLDVGEIFAFTPKGDVYELTEGATPLDFAFHIHTDVGIHCISAKVNGKIVPLRYRLESGDTVEIITSENQTPSKNWLNIAKTSRARTRIRQWLLKVERGKYLKIGENILDKSLKVLNLSLKKFEKEDYSKEILKKIKVNSFNDLYIKLGSGKISIKNILKHIPSFNSENKDSINKDLDKIIKDSKRITSLARDKANQDNSVLVDGMDNLMLRIGKCCQPIPGDSIIGYITRGRGITVHSSNCSRISQGELERKIDVHWNDKFQFKHAVSIRVVTLDHKGVLSQISEAITGSGINIISATAKSNIDKKGHFLFKIEVEDYSELLKIISKIETLESVISVSRI